MHYLSNSKNFVDQPITNRRNDYNSMVYIMLNKASRLERKRILFYVIQTFILCEHLCVVGGIKVEDKPTRYVSNFFLLYYTVLRVR